LHITSSRPKRSVAVPTSASTSAARVTSARTGKITSGIAAAVSFSAPLTSAAITRAPSAASRSAVDRPWPIPAPVTIAIFPSRRPISRLPA
jgi:hypothetical protein